MDLRKIAERMSFIEEIDLDLALWRCLKVQIAKALAGNTKAAEVVFGKLTMPDISPLVELQINTMVDQQAARGLNDVEVVLPQRRALAVQLLEIHDTATKILKLEDEDDEKAAKAKAEAQKAAAAKAGEDTVVEQEDPTPRGPQVTIDESGNLVELD